MKSKKQLKEELHRLIDSIEDKHVLNVLNEDIVPYVVKNRTKEAEVDDDLTEGQLRQLEEAIKESDRGETISIEEFKETMDRWRTELKSAKGSK